MKFRIVFGALCLTLLTSISAHADLTGTQKIRDYIDFQLQDVDIQTLTMEEKEAWLVDPVRLNLNMLIPVYGSTILDNSLYGNIRPPAYIFDWTLGGFIPLGLIVAAGLAGEQLSSNRKKALVGAAVGLYLITRVGVFITINEHIHQYNKYMKVRMGLEVEETSSISLNLGFEQKF